MKKDLETIETLVTNINNIISYYANKEYQNVLYAILTFWNSCNVHETPESILRCNCDKINKLIEKTQDFSQYKNDYMPITLKLSLLNIKTSIVENNLEYIIPIEGIKFNNRQ